MFQKILKRINFKNQAKYKFKLIIKLISSQNYFNIYL